MNAALQELSPLRLPHAADEALLGLPACEPGACFEVLTRRGFNGCAALSADPWQAEVLFYRGQPLAAALFDGKVEPRVGAEALAALLGRSEEDWTGHLEPLAEPLLVALAGLDGGPEPYDLETAEALRALLRTLAQRGASGVLELERGPRWARLVLSGGGVLGCYLDRHRQLSRTLAPLGELLDGPAAARWYAAGEPRPLTVSRIEAGANAGWLEIERQVIWIVSRFEGEWGRARDRGDLTFGLQEALADMLESLLALAEVVERSASDQAALVSALNQLIADARPHRPLPELDVRLREAGVAGACQILVELVGQALRRIVRACPEPTLADYCRQAAQALARELQASSAPAGEASRPSRVEA